MPSVFKRDGLYVIKWRDSTGRWRTKRTNFSAKAEAARFALELEHHADRQRQGLEVTPGASAKMTFGELVDWWWEGYGRKLRSQTVMAFIKKHLLPVLGSLPLIEVTSSRLEELLNNKDDELSPKSVNALHQNVHRIFSLAVRRGLWRGDNPALLVERRKVPKRLPEFLRLEEVPRVLEALDPRWRPLFATAVYTGMRQGELLGLRKSDVDLVDGTIAVARSYDGPTTKGGHADVLPVADELRDYLQEAIDASPSELVFPRAGGQIQSRDLALDKVLRRAMGRASIVIGYLHKCRRKGCGQESRESVPDCGRCPKCNMQLWTKPIPRHVRFHDLRHTTGTLLLKAGVPYATVQRMLRHTDPRLTTEIYGHLDVEDLRAGVNKLRFTRRTAPAPMLGQTSNPEPLGESGVARGVENSFVRGAPVVQRLLSLQNEARSSLEIPNETAGFLQSGRQDLNLRPLGPEATCVVVQPFTRLHKPLVSALDGRAFFPAVRTG
jgi:integrase